MARKVIHEAANRFHVEGTDDEHITDPCWSFIQAFADEEVARSEANEYASGWKRVRVIDTAATS